MRAKKLIPKVLSPIIDTSGFETLRGTYEIRTVQAHFRSWARKFLKCCNYLGTNKQLCGCSTISMSYKTQFLSLIEISEKIRSN